MQAHAGRLLSEIIQVRYVNSIVLAGLIVCAAFLAAGYARNSGAMEGLAVYGGWFLAAYSTLAYILTSVRSVLRKESGFWSTLYPVNFGLTLVAISLFGLHGQRFVVGLLAAVLLGIFSGVVLQRSRVLSLRAAPLVVVTPLLACLAWFIAPFWMYLCVFVAALLLASCLLTLLTLRTANPA
jgi:hypothetical protein